MKPKICDKELTFEECELAILRQAVDRAEKIQGEKKINSPEIQRIIKIVEDFARQNNIICYGGTAINNILPEEDQFYNKDVEIPDYDFYSSTALEDAIKLSDIYVREGFSEVEAKSGQHHGTYKVYVDFIPVADLSYIPKELFTAIKRDAIQKQGIYYSPPNLLRMGMYLELSRPQGDVSRWEKVLKRLSLLNKNYPLRGKECLKIDFQRRMTNSRASNEIYDVVKEAFVEQGVIFFGGYALSLYSQYMPEELRRKLQKIPDFDVLSENPLETAKFIQEKLSNIGITDVKIIRRPGIGEIVAPNYEIKVSNDTIAFIYEPLACHSYNVIKQDDYQVKIATIDTILSFYLAFLYANRPYYDKDRILCMSNFLFDVQEKNRLTQHVLLKRFSLNCMGHQQTIEEMRAEKAQKFIELKDQKESKEFQAWFLRYRPLDNDESSSQQIKKVSQAIQAERQLNKKTYHKSKPKPKPKSNHKPRPNKTNKKRNKTNKTSKKRYNSNKNKNNNKNKTTKKHSSSKTKSSSSSSASSNKKTIIIRV
uniref:Poly(A) polymerase catalytic subunit domain-containing protein n=1 Tax=viral metagenome TaxID=1070528 RepID=A0A6C0IW88_9ZZZZ